MSRTQLVPTIPHSPSPPARSRERAPMRFLPAITSARSAAFSLTRDEARIRLAQPGHTLTEVLQDGAITKIYFDFDLLVPGRAADAGPFSGQELEGHLETVLDRVRHVCECLSQGARDNAEEADAVVEEGEGGGPRNGTGPGARNGTKSGRTVAESGQTDFVIACRHGWCCTKQTWKISIRPFLLGVRIRYDHIPHIMRCTGQLECGTGEPCIWDTSVYKSSEQLLACINGIKSGADRRVLVPCGRTGLSGDLDLDSLDLLCYTAQAVDEAWPLLTVPPEAISRGLAQPVQNRDAGRQGAGTVSSGRPGAGCGSATTIVPEALLHRIVASLNNSRADDRKEWIEVVWVVHRVSVEHGYEAAGEGIAQEFSRRCAAKYNSRAVSKAYYDGRLDGGLGLGSLLHWAKQDNAATPRVYSQIQAALKAAVRAVEAVGGGLGGRIPAAGGGGMLFLEEGEEGGGPGGGAGGGGMLFLEDGEEGGGPSGGVGGDCVVSPPAAGQLVTKKKQQRAGMEVGAGAGQGGGQIQPFSSAGGHAKFRSKLMQQLITLWPAMFSNVTDETFAITFCEGVVRFTTGTMQGYIKNYSVFLEDGSFLGPVYSDVHVKGPFDLHRDMPPHVDYIYNRQSPYHSTLCSVNPPNTTLTLTQNESDPRNLAMVQGQVTGCKNFKVSEKKVRPFQERIGAAVRAHVESIMGPQYGHLFFVNMGTINVVNAPEAASEFALIRDVLLDHSVAGGMRKRSGFIFEPIKGCPCAFIQQCTYEKFINEALKDNETYTNNPRRFDEALKFLQNYEVTKLPQLVPDLDLMSFSNGVLELSSACFTAYAGLDPEGGMAKRAARHHIPLDYTGSCDTPLLDTILAAQFEADVAEVLFALIGRLFFKVGVKDGWQVMPYLVGIGGTGKSLILNVVQHLFAPGMVGNLAAKREEVFGMANLMDKELVMGRDMPAKLSGSLSQEVMQSMTAGEGMEIPRKGQTALNLTTWTTPCIMASNHMPDYVNTGNNVGRRIVTFRFEKTVSSPQEDLQQRMIDTELPNIVARALQAYAVLRERVKLVKGFWKAVPPIMLEWQGQLAASTNKLHQFLAMDDEERKCSITRVEGHVTWILDLKEAFQTAMGGAGPKLPWTPDQAVFSAFGFILSTKAESVCLACKQIAPDRGGPRCCEDYNAANRRQKFVVYSMRLQGCSSHLHT